MADVPFADVFRPVRRNQTVIASDARSSEWRVIVGRDDEHDASLFAPRLLLGPLPERRKLSITRDRKGEEQVLSPCHEPIGTYCHHPALGYSIQAMLSARPLAT